jgi:hypothetical protein
VGYTVHFIPCFRGKIGRYVLYVGGEDSKGGGWMLERFPLCLGVRYLPDLGSGPHGCFLG